jgi:hypothetical protein
MMQMKEKNKKEKELDIVIEKFLSLIYSERRRFSQITCRLEENIDSKSMLASKKKSLSY